MSESTSHRASASPASHRLGRRGEAIAEAYFRRRCYRILARNWRRPSGPSTGEIDLIARRGDTLVFVEVKTRREGAAVPSLEAVDHTKRERFRRTVTSFLERYEHEAWAAVRIDIVAITIGHGGRVVALDHLEDAFGG